MKKLSAVLLALIFVAFCNATAEAAQWVEVSRDQNIICSCDVDSLQIKNGIISCWDRSFYVQPAKQLQVQRQLQVNEPVVTSISLLEYNVTNRTARIITGAFYGATGNMLYHVDANYAEPFVPIPPDTYFETIFKFAKERLGIK